MKCKTILLLTRGREYWVYRDNVCVDKGIYGKKEENMFICIPSDEKQGEHVYLIYENNVLYYLNSEMAKALVFSKFSTVPPLTAPGSVVYQLPTRGVYQRKITSERAIRGDVS